MRRREPILRAMWFRIYVMAIHRNKDGETKNRYPRSKLTGYYAIFSFGPFAFKAYRSKLRGIKPREINLESGGVQCTGVNERY